MTSITPSPTRSILRPMREEPPVLGRIFQHEAQTKRRIFQHHKSRVQHYETQISTTEDPERREALTRALQKEIRQFAPLRAQIASLPPQRDPRMESLERRRSELQGTIDRIDQQLSKHQAPKLSAPGLVLARMEAVSALEGCDDSSESEGEISPLSAESDIEDGEDLIQLRSGEPSLPPSLSKKITNLSAVLCGLGVVGLTMKTQLSYAMQLPTSMGGNTTLSIASQFANVTSEWAPQVIEGCQNVTSGIASQFLNSTLSSKVSEFAGNLTSNFSIAETAASVGLFAKSTFASIHTSPEILGYAVTALATVVAVHSIFKLFSGITG